MPVEVLIYNETYEKLLNMNKIQLLLYKRKFIFSTTENVIAILKHKILSTEAPTSYKEYNLDFKAGGSIGQKNSSFNPAFMSKLKNKTDFSEYAVPFEMNDDKQALLLMVKQLLDKKVKIIIVKMPLHPELVKKIPAESLENFDVFIKSLSNEYNITILDYMQLYNGSYFYDGHHLNKEGKEIFSEAIGTQIIREAMK